MAGLHFDIAGNNADIIRKLKETQKAFEELGKNAENQGKNIDSAFDKVSFGDTLKKQIYEGAQAVNGLTEKIIHQRKAVREITQDVNTLNEAYKRAGRDTDKGKVLLIDLNNAKESLKKEKAALFDLQTQQAQARLSVRRLRDEYALYQKEGQNVIDANNRMAGSFKKTLAAIGGTAMIKKFISDVVRVRGQFQQLEIAFETMLKSKDKASALMGQLTETAAKTPFDLQGIAQGAKQLLAYGTTAEDVNDTLVRLGNIASGLSIPLNDLVWLYGTTMTQGRLFTQDVRQFMGRGIPLVKELAKELGKTEQQINEMVTAGKIGFPQVEKVIRNMTNEGGQFYNLMEKQSASLTGQISNLGDAWDMMLNKIGTQTQGIASAGISTVSSLVENYEEVGKVLVGLIATYGVARTAIALTALENGKYIFTLSKLTTALKASTIAQKALNLAVLKNPYVIVAVAVGTLITTLWALHDSTTAVEKAQKRYNDTLNKQNEKEKEYKKNIESLVAIIQDNNKAEGERLSAMEALKNEYPNIFNRYLTETEFLKKILEYKRLIADEDNKRANVTDQEQLRLETLKLREYEQRKKEGVVLIDIDGNGWGETNVDDAIKAQLEIVNKAKAKVAQYGVNSYLSGIKNLASSDITSTIQDITLSLQALGKSGDNAIAVVASLGGEFSKAQLNSIKAALETEQKVRSGEKKTGSDWVADAKKKYEKALSDLKTFETNKTQLTKEEYERRRKELKDKADVAEKAYKDLGGITGSSLTKQENQAEKLRKEQEKYNLLVDKQELEHIRKAEDLEIQLAQTTIDAMSDGFEKEQAQRELNNKKELQALERQKEDYIRAYIQAKREKFNANPANKGKTFNPSSVKVDSSRWDAIIENTKTNQGLNEWEKREEAMNEYLLKYGTFSQKKEAIDKKYRAAIDKEVDLGKKNSLQKEWDEALTNLDLSKLKEEINWEMIFGDLSKVTKEQLRNIKKQLQEFKNSPEFQKATPEQIEVIESAFNSINNALVDKGGFFGGMVDSVTELKLATEELKKAEEELAEANKKGTEAQKEEAQKKVNAAKKKKQNAEVNVAKSSDKTIQHLTAVGNAIAELGSTAEMSLSSFGNAVGSIVDAFSDAGEKIGGIIGAAFSVLEGIQKQGLDGFIGNILENVAGAIGGIWDTLTFGAFGLKGADYSRYNEMVAQYETINSIWDELIDKKQKYIDISYGIEASKAGKEAASIQRKAMENYRTLGVERLNSGASAGSHSIGRRIWRDMSNEGWTQAQQALGSDWEDSYRDKSRMTWLFDLTSKQLETLKEEAPTFWAKLDGDVRDYLNNIIAGEEKIQEIQNQVKEQLTQTSFDNVFDSFLDTLMDMDSAAEDFSKDFEEYMKRAVLTHMLGSEYEKQLQDWYDNFAKAMDEKRERGKFLRPGKVIEEAGVLTEEEQAELQKQWDAIVSGALDRRNQLASAMGWESESSEDGRKAAQKGIATASQDSIDELRGTMTNVQGHTYNINENTARIATGINTLTEHTKHLTCLADIDNTMQSLLTMRKESIEHLSNIAEYTSNLVEMKEFMRSMKTGIDTLNTKGLTLKR